MKVLNPAQAAWYHGWRAGYTGQLPPTLWPSQQYKEGYNAGRQERKLDKEGK